MSVMKWPCRRRAAADRPCAIACRQKVRPERIRLVSNNSSLRTIAQKYRLLTVLIVVLLFLIFTTIIELAGLGSLWLAVGFLIVIVAAVNTMNDRPALFHVALILALLAAALRLARLFFDDRLVDIAADFLGAALLALTMVVILRRILIESTPSFDVLCGAAAVYFLIATTWAASFELIEDLAPGSFSGLSADQVTRWNQLVYFSLTTLTTLGYGDISPVNSFARLWAALEAALGVLYVAILVARLVALYRPKKGVNRSGT